MGKILTKPAILGRSDCELLCYLRSLDDGLVEVTGRLTIATSQDDGVDHAALGRAMRRLGELHGIVSILIEAREDLLLEPGSARRRQT